MFLPATMRSLTTLLLLSCYTCQPGSCDSDSLPTRNRVFPKDFLFGSATSALQTEGAWNVSGRLPSIWDTFSHKPGKIKDNSTADIACNSYYLYKCDSQMLRYLGADLYRFSISWSRILPNGFANNINQEGKVGITLSTDYCEGLTNSPEDIQAAEDAFDFNVGIFAHPIFSTVGGFPPRLKQLVAEKSAQQGFPRSRLPEFSDEEIAYCKGASDFYGFNHYSTQYWSRKTYKPGKNIPSLEDDLGAKGSFLNYPKTASKHIAVIPHGIRWALNMVRDKYNNPEILITENGVATDEDLVDPQRIDYFKKYISNVLDAIYEDKINITGYLAWSLMDNFELAEGYKPKFGLFKVDHEADNKRRRARLSAIWYRDLISSRTLDPDYTPKFENVEFCAS